MKLLLLMSFMFGCLLPCESHASCGRLVTPQEAFDDATVVFSGTVVDRIEHSISPETAVNPGFIEYVFKVELIWKGPVRDTFGIYPLDKYRIGETYFIYARALGSKATGEYLISGGPCLRNAPIEESVWDRAVLHEPYVVDASKALLRPTVARLKEMALGQGVIASEAQRALEDLQSRADLSADTR
jgi:hypothetical protein